VADIRVLILQQGFREFVDTWTENTQSSPNVEKWKESSTFWPKRLLQGQLEPMQVFFCLDEKVLKEGFETPRLHRLIQQAHYAMWDANLYFVVEKGWQPVWLDPEELEPYRWMEDLLENKVADILEMSVKSSSNYTEAAKRSRERMDKLPRDRTHHQWKCLFQDLQMLTIEEERLLAPYLVESPARLAGDNCLIVFRFQKEGYLIQLQQMVEGVQAGELMIGWVDRLRPPKDLESFCSSKGYELVWLHGIAELYYFLQKLNRPPLAISPVTHERLLGKEATPVRVVNSRFRPYNPQLLITHSYLSAEADNCFTAATDTWELIGDRADNVKVEIYPAIKSVKLAAIVSQFDHLMAWIHIGHGDAEKGLQQSDDELFMSASDWIKSFAAYKFSLPLVLFSSCYSRTVAQKFAEAGVGVAIGFTEAVNKRVCAELTKRVVNAALKFNGERIAILMAFLDGHDVLTTVDSKAAPVAFWSSR